jgi:ATP-binding cassette subfamily B multidrug efflux pump
VLRLTSFLRPDRLAVVLVLVLTFVQSLSSLYLPTLMSNLVDTGVLHGNVPYVLRVGGFMLVVALASGAAAVLAAYYASKATAGFAQRLGLRLFSHVERFSPREFDRFGTSSLIVRATNDVMQVRQMVYMILRMASMAPLMAIGGIILAVHTSPRLSPILVVALPLMGLAVYAIMGRGFRLFASIQEKVDRLNRILRENLTGVRVVRAFSRTEHELQRFDFANRDVTDTAMAAFQLMATMMPAVMLIMNLATVAVAWFGAKLINGDALQIGQLMAFIQYVTQIMFSIMMAAMLFFFIPRGEASAVRIREVLETEPAIVDPPAPERPDPARRALVEFDHVTFHYASGQEPALADVSFSARPGEITAIIGGTGAGKSTLLQLIPRLADVTGGAVRVDGLDVRRWAQHELRARIAYVPQQSILFSGTVLENVRYGDPEAPEEAVGHAVEVAQAMEFVSAMDQGLHAPVAQGGVSLSGGQRQRLAIARALVRRAEIYLFDDSFSALDYRTDARLRAALRRELSSATVLIVAQRVSTVMDADRILVLDDGRLAGSGTHGELLATCPVYQEIVASQVQPEVVA